ncbi:hypothetical protein Taro_043199 [Colocasia esculenta]|uniref:Methyltransferase type 11 domain-containing protein n=1 Tax=Colocasia esculenta TaxID=4460 RepID=A0A843WIT8_COLES|nr:hypothetical protein [Colocasia esculenta]
MGFYDPGVVSSVADPSAAQVRIWSRRPSGLPASRVSYLVADAHQQPFPDGQFDLVWSMSSAELMEDKRKFVSELARVAAPGGTIVIVT